MCVCCGWESVKLDTCWGSIADGISGLQLRCCSAGLCDDLERHHNAPPRFVAPGGSLSLRARPTNQNRIAQRASNNKDAHRELHVTQSLVGKQSGCGRVWHHEHVRVKGRKRVVGAWHERTWLKSPNSRKMFMAQYRVCPARATHRVLWSHEIAPQQRQR